MNGDARAVGREARDGDLQAVERGLGGVGVEDDVVIQLGVVDAHIA
jgi:hypothetical protein